MIKRLLLSAALWGSLAFGSRGAEPATVQPELGLRHNAEGFDLGPETTAGTVGAAAAAIPTHLPPGPFQPSWSSLQTHYTTPAW